MRAGVPWAMRLHVMAYPPPPVCSAGVPHIPIYTNSDIQRPSLYKPPTPVNQFLLSGLHHKKILYKLKTISVN